MSIREATNQDIPAIVDLLKLSLGEGSSIKSEAYWRWKHVDNPFGQSPVVVAEQDGQLVGVRAFMRWEWMHHDRKLQALRAVDTATHPDFQGRGIFKKLTLKLLEDSQLAGQEFIYNTPNKQSLPGYLKMGWEELGKISICIHPIAPYRSLVQKFSSKKPFDEKTLIRYADWSSLSAKWDTEIASTLASNYPDKIKPAYPEGYLTWRYAKCPVQQYYFIQENDYLVVFYPKRQTIGIELRLVEFWANHKVSIAHLKSTLKHLAKSTGASYFSASHLPHQEGLMNSLGFLKPRSIGPMMTFRPLNFNVPSNQSKLDGWLPLMGAMELF